MLGGSFGRSDILQNLAIKPHETQHIHIHIEVFPFRRVVFFHSVLKIKLNIQTSRYFSVLMHFLLLFSEIEYDQLKAKIFIVKDYIL